MAKETMKPYKRQRVFQSAGSLNRSAKYRQRMIYKNSRGVGYIRTLQRIAGASRKSIAWVPVRHINKDVWILAK